MSNLDVATLNPTFELDENTLNELGEMWSDGTEPVNTKRVIQNPIVRDMLDAGMMT